MKTQTLAMALMLVVAGGNLALPQERPRVDLYREGALTSAALVDDSTLWHTTQLFPVDGSGNIAGATVAQQCETLRDRLQEVLGDARIVKLNIYAQSDAAAEEVRAILVQLGESLPLPPTSFVVGRLAHPHALVAVDAVATSAEQLDRVTFKAGAGGLAGKRSAVLAGMPAGSRVYIAGQAEPGTLPEATRKTLESLGRTLKVLNLTPAHVVQVKCFVTPMSDVSAVYDEVGRFFGEQTTPAVSMVEWKSTLPIEIEIAAWGGVARTGEPLEFLTPPGMTSSPVFSRVARINHGPTIFVAGLYASQGTPADGEVADIFRQLESAVGKAGGDLRHLAKATYYCSTDAASQKLNELRPNYYDAKRPPSASKAIVPAVGMNQRGLTLDMIAVPRPN